MYLSYNFSEYKLIHYKVTAGNLLFINIPPLYIYAEHNSNWEFFQNFEMTNPIYGKKFWEFLAIGSRNFPMNYSVSEFLFNIM